MTERAPQIERREIRLPDGRRLVYYPFPGTRAPASDAPSPGPPPAPAPTPQEER